MPSGVVTAHLRNSVRLHWRSLLAVALMLGLTGGLALASLASARRTASAYDRLLSATKSSDLSVDYGPYHPNVSAELAKIPGVKSSATYVAFNATTLTADGHPDPAADFETVGSVDGRYFDQDRVSVVRGRLPDPSRSDEVAVNDATAVLDHIEVGDRLDLGIVSNEQLSAADDPSQLTAGAKERVTVVGEIVFADEVIQDDNDVISRMLTTPAFTDKYAPLASYSWQGLRLERGTDIGSIEAAVRRRTSPSAAQNGGFVLLRSTSDDTARVERAIRPQVSALTIFGALAAVVAVALALQAVARQMRLDERRLTVYRALGLTPAQLTVIGAAPHLLAVAAGALLAVAVALALSPLSPIGVLHRIEISRGLDVDTLVLLGGAAVLGLLVGVGTIISAHRSARRLSAAFSARPKRPSRLVTWASQAPGSVALGTGARHALQPGSGPATVPVRSVVAGAVVAITALVAAICFGASLRALVDEPRLYGWNWDLAVIDQAGYGTIDPDRTAAALDNNPLVEGWAMAAPLSSTLDGSNVALLGLTPGDTVAPPVLSGRAIRDGSEIVLGPTTLERLGKRIGDTVELGETRTQLRIVGTAALPAIGQAHSVHPSTGEGAIVATKAVGSVLGPQTPDGANEETTVFIRLRKGVSRDEAMTGLSEAASGIGQFPGSTSLVGVQRPAEIVNAGSIGSAPTIMAALLMTAAMISLGLALVASVRRRRRDLAVIKALGFTRGQVTTSVFWQSLIVSVIGIVVGVPIGVVLGRWSWTLFARQLSVVPRPVVPLATIGVVIAAILVAAMLAAVVPSRLAGRVPVNRTLRDE